MTVLTMPRVMAGPVARDTSPSVAQAKPAIKQNIYIGTLGVFLGAGIATLSARLISVGLADLRGALHLGIEEAAWITTAYNMGQMFMGPFSVYVGGLLGVRKVLLFMGTVFVITSLLLPFSPNLSVMLFLQVISGMSSGTFYPLTMSYALRNLPIRFTIYSIGAYSIDILAATSLAIPLEAWYVEHLSWRWLFWNSALLTPLMMLCIYKAVPNPPPRTGPKPNLSWRGFLYGSLAFSLIYGVLEQGERLDWLNSGVIVAMLATAAFLLVATLVRRLVSPNPAVRLGFLVNRNTLILGAGLFSFRFVMLGIAFLIPSFLGAIQNYRALQTGKVMLWVALPQLVMGYLTSRVMRFVDGRLIFALGFATAAAACLMNAQLTTAWASDNFWYSQLVMAVGLSFCFVGLIGMIAQQGMTTGALSKPFEVLTYSSFFHTVRLFGGELGTSAMQRLVTVREQFHSNMLGLGVDGGDFLTDERLRMLTGGVSSGSSGLEEAQRRAVTLLGGQVKQQAYTLAFQDGFIAIAAVAAGIIVLIAFMRRMKIYFDSSAMEPPR